MKQSLTYYITILVIKLKGIKREFSKTPIDYNKIRKEDVPIPKGKFYKLNVIDRFTVLNSLVTEIAVKRESNQLIIFIHGGAFISGPAQHHWDSIKKIANNTNHKIWMCDYPKAPENNISQISDNIDAIYRLALKQFDPKNIILVGDSVGGTLIASLTQRLILKELKLPKKIILVTPVMDASMTNLEIEKVDLIDPMLSKLGVLSAKKMCVKDYDLKDVMISPLYGSFYKFPETILFLAENDIFYPDQKLVVRKLKNARVNLQVIEGENMPHIWPLLPVMKEARESLGKIIGKINS